MISLYILLIASVVAIFGLIVTIFSHIKKVNRSKKMGHFFLVVGVIVAIIAGLSMNKEKQARQAAIENREKLQSEQIYDAELVHVSDKKVRIKRGQAKVTFYVSKDTSINIHSNHEQLHDLEYKPNREKKDIVVTFVIAGKYTVTAIRGQNKIVKHVTVLKDNNKKVGESDSNSVSVSEVVAEPYSEEVGEESESSEVSEGNETTATVVDSGTDESVVTDTPASEGTPSTDYQPVWTPTTPTGSWMTSETTSSTVNSTTTSGSSLTESVSDESDTNNDVAQ